MDLESEENREHDVILNFISRKHPLFRSDTDEKERADLDLDDQSLIRHPFDVDVEVLPSPSPPPTTPPPPPPQQQQQHHQSSPLSSPPSLFVPDDPPADDPFTPPPELENPSSPRTPRRARNTTRTTAFILVSDIYRYSPYNHAESRSSNTILSPLEPSTHAIVVERTTFHVG